MYGHIHTILSSTPNHATADEKSIAACLETCISCELACVGCADACLGERELEGLRRAIRLTLDCADVCGTTARMLSRAFEPDLELVRTQVAACARACGSAAVECQRHASRHAHCRACADACIACEESCMRLLSEMPALA